MNSLLLLAASLKPSGKLYGKSRPLMELWSTWRWLNVAVQFRGVE